MRHRRLLVQLFVGHYSSSLLFYRWTNSDWLSSGKTKNCTIRAQLPRVVSEYIGTQVIENIDDTRVIIMDNRVVVEPSEKVLVGTGPLKR